MCVQHPLEIIGGPAPFFHYGISQSSCFHGKIASDETPEFNPVFFRDVLFEQSQQFDLCFR